MKLAGNLFSAIYAELLVVALLILSFSYFTGIPKKTIVADGIGYYDYLPSVFIHSDINRKNHPEKEKPELYKRINSLGVYTSFEELKINKYTVGSALLISPFFLTNLIMEGNNSELSGYEESFQSTVMVAALFYLFLALIFLRKILKTYKIKGWVIRVTQLNITLATSIAYYTNQEASFSHVYSLFAITTFIYIIRRFFLSPKSKYVLIAVFLLGLIFTIRQINIIIVLFIPFLAGSPKTLKEGWRYFISKPIFIGLSFILLIITIFPQLLAWYLQIGKWFVYSYQDEGFNFLEPNFVNILFSYRKGLFVYTPITLLGIAGLIIMLLKKRYYEFFTWLAFFLFLTYILSSWWCWYYGGSYGLRAYVDFYCVLFIPFAVLLNFSNKPVRLLVIAASCFFIVLTTIQIYQYKEFILQWSGMDKERYWKVFLKTDDTYKGLFWKKIFDKETLELKDSSASANFIIPKNENKAVVSMYSSNIKNFNSVSLVEMICENEFEEKPMPKIEFIVKDSVSNETLYKNNKPLYHFKNSKTRNKGFYFYEIPRADNNPVLIYVKAFTSEKELVLKNVKLNFYSKK